MHTVIDLTATVHARVASQVDECSIAASTRAIVQQFLLANRSTAVVRKHGKLLLVACT